MATSVGSLQKYLMDGEKVLAPMRVFYATKRPTVFVQFRAPGLDKNAEARFRLRGGRKNASLDLVRIVRQQSLTGRPESTDVGPKEDKGNQPAKQ